MENQKILDILGALLPGEALERIADELADPGANLDYGDAALVGAALSALGAKFTEHVKATYAGVQTAIPSREGDIFVKSRAPSEYHSVDTASVKKMFPQNEYPDLYKLTKVKGSVSLELPGGLK